MYYTDARAAHYKAGVPRDQRTFFSKLGGLNCPKCGADGGFSTLNEIKTWEGVAQRNPYRCAVCQHQWDDD
jgi:hypothetical protein